LEAGPGQDPSGLQRAFGLFCWEFVNLASSIQTQLVLDTHKEVADARVTIANTETVVEDTQMMVADIHRKVLAGQEGTSSQNHSVGATCYSQTSEY
jgi:hypothetical protein